jgi:LysM repeat protein
MSRYTPARAAVRTSRAGGRRSLAVLVVLAAVTMAHAPAVITVQPGDTLWALAKKHGTTVDALQALNGLDGNGTIYAGRTLKISGSGSGGSSSGGGGAGTHVVTAGDTLSHIALRYGVSQAAIRSANGMDSSMVRIGRKLVIPGSSSPAPSAGAPTHNAGATIPETVRSSVVRHREILASRQLPTKAQARQMVRDTARRMGVDPSLALAVAYHESGFQQRVVSGVDAIGVMQVLPSTGRGLSRSLGRELDLLDTQDNITAGVLLLQQLVRATGSDDKALAGYYQGLGSVRSRGVLPQTTTYIQNINALRPRFANG